MEERTIRLYRSKVKNESVLAMTNRVYEVLDNRAIVRDPEQVYVFEGLKGGPLRNGRKSFKNACERAGLSDVSFHTLRHTFASRLVQNNISLYNVQQLLGHSSSATTERYAHLQPSHATVQAANILNQLQGGK